MDDRLRSRLDEMRRRGNPGVAPFWVARLTPAELLALDLPSKEWAPLARGDALMRLGRFEEARELLAGAGQLEPGLLPVREYLLAKLDELDSREGEEAALRLTGWLENVLLWRATLTPPA